MITFWTRTSSDFNSFTSSIQKLKSSQRNRHSWRNNNNHDQVLKLTLEWILHYWLKISSWNVDLLTWKFLKNSLIYSSLYITQILKFGTSYIFLTLLINHSLKNQCKFQWILSCSNTLKILKFGTKILKFGTFPIQIFPSFFNSNHLYILSTHQSTYDFMRVEDGFT